METNKMQPEEQMQTMWLESMALLFRYKMHLFILSLVVTAATAVYLFGFAKVWYKSSANVLPARKPGGSSLDNLTSGLSNAIKDIGLTQLSGRTKPDGVYSPLALIGSRRLQEEIITEFGLMKEYESENMEDAVKTFSELAKAEVLEEGNIAVSFEDTDPKRAAVIANRLVRAMNETNSRLAIEEARFNRTFIEMRYAKLLVDLDSSERALGEFQRKYGVYELKEQARAQLGALSSLEQQKYMTEIQLQNARQLYGDNAAETKVLESQLAELRGKLNDLKTGMDRNASTYFVPMDVLPDVALDYLRLTREVEIQSKIKALLLPSYEQAKLDESKQSLAFVILDSAVTPLKKSRPKRSLYLLSAFIGTFALSFLGILVYARAKNGWQKIKQYSLTVHP
jgi:uncharacterized protein involved in exopolysaccharide biosynthesis